MRYSRGSRSARRGADHPGAADPVGPRELDPCEPAGSTSARSAAGRGRSTRRPGTRPGARLSALHPSHGLEAVGRAEADQHLAARPWRRPASSRGRRRPARGSRAPPRAAGRGRVRSDARDVLDGLPVDRVVQMSVQVDVGWHAAASERDSCVGRRVGQLEPGRDAAPGRRLAVQAESLDPRGPLVRAEMDPDAVDFRPPASVAPERPPSAGCDRSEPAAPRHELDLSVLQEGERARRFGSAARTTGATALPSRSPARRRSRRPGAGGRARRAGRGRAGRRRRAAHAAAPRTSAPATGSESQGRAWRRHYPRGCAGGRLRRPGGAAAQWGEAMRMRGLEPPRPEGHTDLNRARLPIPPHPRGATV